VEPDVEIPDAAPVTEPASPNTVLGALIEAPAAVLSGHAAHSLTAGGGLDFGTEPTEPRAPRTGRSGSRPGFSLSRPHPRPGNHDAKLLHTPRFDRREAENCGGVLRCQEGRPPSNRLGRAGASGGLARAQRRCFRARGRERRTAARSALQRARWATPSGLRRRNSTGSECYGRACIGSTRSLSPTCSLVATNVGSWLVSIPKPK